MGNVAARNAATAIMLAIVGGIRTNGETGRYKKRGYPVLVLRKEEKSMPAHYEKQKGEVQVGVIGFRGPDGSVICTRPFYKPAEEVGVNEGKLTDGEKEVCEGIVSTMTDLFKQYVEGVKKLEREQKKRKGKEARR